MLDWMGLDPWTDWQLELGGANKVKEDTNDDIEEVAWKEDADHVVAKAAGGTSQPRQGADSTLLIILNGKKPPGKVAFDITYDKSLKSTQICCGRPCPSTEQALWTPNPPPRCPEGVRCS